MAHKLLMGLCVPLAVLRRTGPLQAIKVNHRSRCPDGGATGQQQEMGGTS
jgi:hypothetical protein